MVPQNSEIILYDRFTIFQKLCNLFTNLWYVKYCMDERRLTCPDHIVDLALVQVSCNAVAKQLSPTKWIVTWPLSSSRRVGKFPCRGNFLHNFRHLVASKSGLKAVEKRLGGRDSRLVPTSLTFTTTGFHWFIAILCCKFKQGTTYLISLILPYFIA